MSEEARFAKAARRSSFSLRSFLVYIALLIGFPVGFGILGFLVSMHDGFVTVLVAQFGALVGVPVGVIAVLVRWIVRRTRARRS